MFGLGKFSPNIDELQILIIVLHFLPHVIKKSLTVTATIFGSVADGPA